MMPELEAPQEVRPPRNQKRRVRQSRCVLGPLFLCHWTFSDTYRSQVALKKIDDGGKYGALGQSSSNTRQMFVAQMQAEAAEDWRTLEWETAEVSLSRRWLFLVLGLTTLRAVSRRTTMPPMS